MVLKIKQILIVGMLIPTVLLTGCSASSDSVKEKDDTEVVASEDVVKDSEGNAVEFMAQTPEFIFGSSFFGGNIAPDAKIGQFNREDILAGTWTVNEYVKKAIHSNYLASGYWKNDKYIVEGVEEISNLYDTEDNFTLWYDSAVKDSKKPNIETNILVPSQNKIQTEQCLEDWVENSCFFTQDRITQLNSFELGENNTIKYNVNTRIPLLYEGNDGSEVEVRNYVFNVSLSQNTDKNAIQKGNHPFLISNVELVNLDIELVPLLEYLERDVL